MDDPFIRNYIKDLLKNVRSQVILKLIKPYTRIRIPFISKVKMTIFFISVYISQNSEIESRRITVVVARCLVEFMLF